MYRFLIAPKYKPSDKTEVELRNAIVEYCKNILKSVGVDDDTPIYLGKNYNDLSSAGLKTTTKKIEFPSKENKNLYLDAFGGRTWSAYLANKAKVFYEPN